MLAYLGVSSPPSSSMVPGNPPCRSSDAPHPIKPAVTATAHTLDSDQTEAARGSWRLPETARRRRDVVKRCRPAMHGPRRAAVATTDRPSGIALIARRFADMQGDPESRNKRSFTAPGRDRQHGSKMGIGSFVPGVQELEAAPVNTDSFFFVFAWEMVNTPFFFLRPPSRENFRRWSRGSQSSSGAGLVRANGALTYRLVMVR